MQNPCVEVNGFLKRLNLLQIMERMFLFPGPTLTLTISVAPFACR